MLKYLAIVAVALGVLSACAPPQEADTSEADLATLKGDVLNWVGAFNAGDADGVAALYTDDAIVMAPGQPMAVGRSAIRDLVAGDIEAMQGIVFDSEESDSAGVDGNMGWASGTYRAKDAAGNVLDTGKYLATYQRIGGEWQIVRDIWNSDAKPTSPAQKLAEAFVDAIDKNDTDRIGELVSDDFKRVAPDQNANGPEEAMAFFAGIHETYANFRISADAYGPTDGGVFVHWITVSDGEKGKQTADPVKVSGITLLKVADGKITDEIVHYDPAAFNAQLGTETMPHAK